MRYPLMPGCLLVPIFLAAGLFWVFGPDWSWLPFNVVFAVLAITVFGAGPTRIVTQAPSAAQSTSHTFAVTFLLAVGIAIGLFFKGRYWELILSGIIFLLSAVIAGKLWGLLRTFGRV